MYYGCPTKINPLLVPVKREKGRQNHQRWRAVQRLFVRIFQGGLAKQFTQYPAELRIMAGKVKEDVPHGFRKPFAVHVMELAVIGTCIDDNIVTGEVHFPCNLIHLFHKGHRDPE